MARYLYKSRLTLKNENILINVINRNLQIYSTKAFFPLYNLLVIKFSLLSQKHCKQIQFISDSSRIAIIRTNHLRSTSARCNEIGSFKSKLFFAQRYVILTNKSECIIFRHVNGRVVVALANGQIAVFKRTSSGEWDLSQYHIVQIGLPHQSVRKLAVVGDKVWCGYRNKIHVLQPRELKIIHTLEAHPRRESPVSTRKIQFQRFN